MGLGDENGPLDLRRVLRVGVMGKQLAVFANGLWGIGGFLGGYGTACRFF